MRISATVLESFRLFVTADWMQESDLLATIRGEATPSHQMDLGRAYHAILEEPDRYRATGGYDCGGFQFADDVMQPMLDLVDRRGVFEVKSTRTINGVTLVAKADQLIGAHINEFKTKCNSSFDADRYFESYQWRVLALVFEPVAITYRIACLSEAPNGVIALRSLEHVTLYPYAELHADCGDLVRRFCDYVTRKGLDGYLKERQRQREAA